jgi:hypothetical protein
MKYTLNAAYGPPEGPNWPKYCLYSNIVDTKDDNCIAIWGAKLIFNPYLEIYLKA